MPFAPSLGGQPAFFVVAQLFLFRDGRRGKAPTPMDAFASKLTDDDLRAYGELFAKLAPPAPPATPRSTGPSTTSARAIQRSSAGRRPSPRDCVA